ncbi:MAG: 2-amino-4-ketopentanoate thiolase [Bacillota bacterium]|nr:2-amino-4-ketopentanoate thiolase [Bacillota bacterium]
MIRKGTYVEIEEIVLKPEERASHLPEDTKAVPLKVWIRGFCQNDCETGEEAEIVTATGRLVKGIVTQEKPRYTHDYGEYVEEIENIGKQAREILGVI